MNKISIITSTLNSVNGLERTIESIKFQSEKPFQWIIIDGASIDGTLNIIRENSNVITDWVSEPDNGIYYAWNKALDLVKGDWIQFIGAGDEYADYTTLSQVSKFLESIHPKIRIAYGQVQYISPHTRSPLEVVGEPWEIMKNKWDGLKPAIPAHPGVFHHRSLFEEKKFSLKYDISGDTHFLLHCLKSTEPAFIPILIDRMTLGGKSGTIESSLTFNREIIAICKELNIPIPISRRMRSKLIDSWKLLSIRILGNLFTERIIDTKRSLSSKPKIWSNK